MLRRTALTRLSFWEMPIMEQMNFSRYFKTAGDGERGAFAKELPRTVHGFYEYHHPCTEDICRYYPYRKDLLVNGNQRPTIESILMDHYLPPMLNDEQRVSYVAAKTGRSEKEVARELFRMRRLKYAMAQSFRDKLSGHWVRQQHGDWNITERKYFETLTKAASFFGTDFYQTHSYDPYIMYSPYYQCGDICDAVLNKTVRTKQQYLFCYISVDGSIPRARIPGVVGSCKAPLQDMEPSALNILELRLSCCAYLAKKDRYVTDHMYDTNHDYRGAIINFARGSDMEIEFELIPLELKPELGEALLRDYYDNYVAPFGGSQEGRPGIMT